LIKAVAERNPNRTARGQALLGLANIARQEFVSAEYHQNSEVERLLHEARKAFELVLRDYGDCPYLRTSGGGSPRRTLGEEAKVALFDLNRLRIGRIAPDIEGEDLDGVKFKLSDSRGKVVLLVFWASWCGPCMAEIPHEKELVERFRGRPFVLIGVNGDSIKAQAAEAVEKHGIPWRSFWNEGQASGEPISVAWNVRGWPTVYLLDHEGVIRHKYLRGEKMDEPLEQLVTAAEAGRQRQE
jgi:peroxiredoxin